MCPFFMIDQTVRAVETEERAGKAGTGMPQLSCFNPLCVGNIPVFLIV